MNQCFFCTAKIHEYAKTCGHCGNSQPSQKEIDREYKKIAASYARGSMLVNPSLLVMIMFWLVVITLFFSVALFTNALFTNLWDRLPSLSPVRDFLQRINSAGSEYFVLIILFVPLFIIFWIKTNVFGKYLAKTVFENAV